jgi:hypothetical protein
VERPGVPKALQAQAKAVQIEWAAVASTPE